MLSIPFKISFVVVQPNAHFCSSNLLLLSISCPFTMTLFELQVGRLPCIYCFAGMSISGSCSPSMWVWTQLRTFRRELCLPGSSKQAWLLGRYCSSFRQFQLWWQIFFSRFYHLLERLDYFFVTIKCFDLTNLFLVLYGWT